MDSHQVDEKQAKLDEFLSFLRAHKLGETEALLKKELINAGLKGNQGKTGEKKSREKRLI